MFDALLRCHIGGHDIVEVDEGKLQHEAREDDFRGAQTSCESNTKSKDHSDEPVQSTWQGSGNFVFVIAFELDLLISAVGV